PLSDLLRLLTRFAVPIIPPRSVGSVRAELREPRARSGRVALRSRFACKEAAILDRAGFFARRSTFSECTVLHSHGGAARGGRFWILDLGSWIRYAMRHSPQSKIQNLRSKICGALTGFLFLAVFAAHAAAAGIDLPVGDVTQPVSIHA